MSLTSQPPNVRRATGRAPSDLAQSGVPSAAYPPPAPTAASSAPPFPRRPLRQLLEEPGTTASYVDGGHGSGIMTLLLTPAGAGAPRLAVKVPTTPSTGLEVEREARMLVELRRMELGPLRATLPRFVQLCDADGRVALVTSALPGRALPRAFCGFGPAAHRQCRPAELSVVAAWLERFQDATWQRPAPVELLPTKVLESLDQDATSCGSPGRPRGGRQAPTGVVAERAHRVRELLGAYEAPRSAVHGDLRAARVLVDGVGATARVSGVVGWRRAARRGEPLGDLARFAVTHTGHRATTRSVPGAHVLAGRGGQAEHARQLVRRGLARLGLPEPLWYPVSWAATAALAADEGPGPRRAAMLRLLARVPDPAVRV